MLNELPLKKEPVVWAIGIIIALCGILGLVGTLLPETMQYFGIPTLGMMQFSCAISFIATGILILSLAEERYKEKQWLFNGIVPICTAIMFFLMVPPIVSIVSGMPLTVEDLLANTIRTTAFRVSAPSALCFFLISMLGFFSIFVPHYKKAYEKVGWLIAAVGAIALIGHAIGVQALYFSMDSSADSAYAMPITTAALFFLAGTALVLLSTENTCLHGKRNTFRLSSKIIFGFLVITLFSALSGFFTYSAYQQTVSQIEYETSATMPVLITAYEMEAKTEIAYASLVNVIIHYEQPYENFNPAMAGLNVAINDYEGLATSKRINNVQVFASNEQAYMKAFARQARERSEKFNSIAQEASKSEISANATQALLLKASAAKTAMDEIVDVQLQVAKSDERSQEALLSATAMRNNLFIITIILLSIIGAIILSIFMAESISRPIRKLSHTINEISEGKLNATIDPEVKTQEDELGELANSFDRMLVSLKLAMRSNSQPRMDNTEEKKENQDRL
ncbi:MAG: HAMP domain-containing protein [Candidatus Micrarchaeia archaeon]|jgi:HAMP domain-containing protein